MYTIEQQEQPAEVTIKCDICGGSCQNEFGNHSFLRLHACWPYGSEHDLETWDAQVCEACTVNILEGIINFQKSEYMPLHNNCKRCTT